MLARVGSFAMLLTLIGFDQFHSIPVAAPTAVTAAAEHQYAIYPVNGQSFLVDGKTGDVWVYGDTKDGKGFASVPVLGLGGVMQQYNPRTKKIEPLHEYPSWFHAPDPSDPLGIRPSF